MKLLKYSVCITMHCHLHSTSEDRHIQTMCTKKEQKDGRCYLTNCNGTRVSNTESFCSLTSEESFAGSCAIQNNVSNDDIVLRFE